MAACGGCSAPTPYARNADPLQVSGPASATARPPPEAVDGQKIEDFEAAAGRGAAAAIAAEPDREGPPLRAVFFGDTGTGTSEQLQVAYGLTRHCRGPDGCDLAVLLGDIVYENGITSIDDPLRIERFEKPYKGLGAPIWLVLGNHDYRGDVDAWVKAYGGPKSAGTDARAGAGIDARLPARYYTFKAGEVRFIVLDSNRLDGAQGRWLDAVVAESAAAHDRWVVAVAHHPWRSFGWHGHARPSDARFFATHLCNRVDFFIAGHEHDKQVLDPICGVHLVIAGSGAKLRDVGRGEGTRFARSTLGFARIEFGGDVATLQLLAHDQRVEYERRYVRVRAAETRAADGICRDRRDDPDCEGVVCAAGDGCNPACANDPDCVGAAVDDAMARACPCDKAGGVCELREADRRCGCDPACAAGVLPCIADHHCDPRCASDPDCR